MAALKLGNICELITFCHLSPKQFPIFTKSNT
jgi:hypothetical protein